MSRSVPLANARLLSEGPGEGGDLPVLDGRIEHIGSAISAPADATVIDAAGCVLLPGMIDDQARFREPGWSTRKVDLATG
jgi:dihydroorotase